MDRVVHIENLNLSINDKKIFRSLNFSLLSQGITVILGPSGTGKSTLLRVIAGLMKQANVSYTGKIKIQGLEQEHCTQSPALVSQKLIHLQQTVKENILSNLPKRSQTLQSEQLEIIRELCKIYQQDWILSELTTSIVHLSRFQQRILSIFRQLLAKPYLLLLDEPTVSLSDDDADRLLQFVQRIAQSIPVLMVSHHISQTKRVADYVVLIANGQVQEHTTVHEFYQNPQNELTKQFLRTGSCAEFSADDLDQIELNDRKVPVVDETVLKCDDVQVESFLKQDLMSFTATMNGSILASAQHDFLAHSIQFKSQVMGPRGFVWLIRGRLAGVPCPGVVVDTETDLNLLKNVEITDLISLTEKSFDPYLAAQYGFGVVHFPIIDMKAPTLAESLKFCEYVDEKLAAGKTLAVHCKAGLGRTGLMLAVYFLWCARANQTAEQAIDHIRGLNALMIQSQEQIDFLVLFVNHLKKPFNF